MPGTKCDQPRRGGSEDPYGYAGLARGPRNSPARPSRSVRIHRMGGCAEMDGTFASATPRRRRRSVHQRGASVPPIPTPTVNTLQAGTRVGARLKCVTSSLGDPSRTSVEELTSPRQPQRTLRRSRRLPQQRLPRLRRLRPEPRRRPRPQPVSLLPGRQQRR